MAKHYALSIFLVLGIAAILFDAVATSVAVRMWQRVRARPENLDALLAVAEPAFAIRGLRDTAATFVLNGAVASVHPESRSFTIDVISVSAGAPLTAATGRGFVRFNIKVNDDTVFSPLHLEVEGGAVARTLQGGESKLSPDLRELRPGMAVVVDGERGNGPYTAAHIVEPMASFAALP